jgi:hypothetical protein
MYHVMNRGGHQEPIFRDDEDRELGGVRRQGESRAGALEGLVVGGGVGCSSQSGVALRLPPRSIG